MLLNDEVMEFANKEMANVVLSLDGRREINDANRPFRNGKERNRPSIQWAYTSRTDMADKPHH